ncbi:MAG: recombinase family protein [Bacillota bacterium]|nr:recombinase family protein [Bacillota bacterium]HOA78835.1 recombinase family protein [Bacilli bacterium]HPZ27601.1 recombinase family protein [Bacilli bacterium]HQC89872.1 recombinase family protein [Bacilli bacterium]
MDEERATIVRLIYRMFLVEGKTCTGIASYLKSQHIKTPTGKSTNWTKNTVNSILTNEKYMVRTWNAKGRGKVDNKTAIQSVKGIGPAGLNYLFMLAGDPDRCKPDVHIHRFIYDDIGVNVSDEQCQILLTDVVKLLKYEYPNLTVRSLDSIIWNKYQIGNKKKLEGCLHEL